MRYTDRKAFVQDYTAGTFQLIHAEKPVLIPQIRYITNDSWEIVSGISGDNGFPILQDATYSKGHLYVLTIPDNFSDLYNLPAEALNKIRQVLCAQLNVQIEGSSKISSYVYDNNTFIVESFLDKETVVKAVTPQSVNTITDINTGDIVKGEIRKPGFSYIEKNSGSKNVFTFALKPHSFRVFKVQ